MTWTYGDAQERYSVVPNSVWTVTGKEHRFLCGDVLKLEASGLLDQHIGQVDVLYTDGPWTASIYKNFYKNADLQPDFSFIDFYTQFVQMIRRHCNGVLFVECGKTTNADVFKQFTDAGAKTFDMLDCSYTPKHTTYYLWVGTFNQDMPAPDLHWTTRHEFDVVNNAIKHLVKPGTRFWDPLCGSMTFLQPAARAGATVLGSEINPRKFAEGLRTMERFGKVIKL